MTVVRPTTVKPFDVDLDPLAELVRARFGAALDATPMPGGASTRRYYRVALPDGASAVAMYVPEGGKPEEVQKAHGGTRWPFLEVRDLLAEKGVDVPKILAEDTARGWLILEDLGDETLANRLLAHPHEKPALYTRAVTELARAHLALAALPPGSVVGARAFDYELLRWEIEHFKEWGLDARGKPLAESDVAAWDRLAEALARRVDALPKGFVHRDYQSRNLMVKNGRLVWIDFQDALLGPRVYDLVALLNDSYQEFDRAFVEARLGEYAKEAGVAHVAALVNEFDLVTVQRKLKDAGRFVFIDVKKHNPSFLKFVTPTIAKVGAALARLAPHDGEMAELRAILRRALGDELG
ncbi:MAG TPA: phosphotransferase [Labilithrix sp.]